MDYYFRGTGHVHGGIGALADAMVTAIRRLGGVVRLADRVRSIERTASGWRTLARRGVIESNAVVANVLPEALSTMVDVRSPALTALSQRVEQSWGAAMWYLGVRDDEPLGRAAKHIECVDDPSQPFIEGNHVFISLSSRDERDRAPEGQRTVTCSTHVRAGALRSMREDEQRAYVELVQRRMRQTIARRAPEIAERVVMEMPASPRTFERFTGRPGGFVGGVPRRVGLSQYARLWPMEVERGLWLVGDSVGLGQSTLATAITAMRTVDALSRALHASSDRRALPAWTASERETVRS
jgi:phytoene dehydrogenase-like protein